MDGPKFVFPPFPFPKPCLSFFLSFPPFLKAPPKIDIVVPPPSKCYVIDDDGKMDRTRWTRDTHSEFYLLRSKKETRKHELLAATNARQQKQSSSELLLHKNVKCSASKKEKDQKIRRHAKDFADWLFPGTLPI
jgi:hypothetical protein